jgi:hypothetical protein
MLAVVSVLWFIRARHFNATNAGWGDQEQDRDQWLLGQYAYRPRRTELHCHHRDQIEARTHLNRNGHSTIRTGNRCHSLVSVIGIILAFPGWFAALSTFGVHSGAGYKYGMADFK